MLVGNLVDFRKEVEGKKEWQPSGKIRAYCDAQYAEFRNDQFQYQKSYKALNNRTPSQYFELAEEDAYKFVPPPKDPNDWRNFVRAGDERNKLDGLLSFLRNLNFRPEPELRDWGGDVDQYAGEVATAGIRFLNVLDNAEEKDMAKDFSMFVHGTLIEQVRFNVKKCLKKAIRDWKPEDGIEGYDPVLSEVEDKAFVESTILKPNRVYFSDITKISKRDQDHIWYEAVVPYASAYRMFHSWSQWKYVKPYNATEDAWTDTTMDVETESTEATSPNRVRIKWRESEITNELSIYCNKVLMTPPGLKLPEGCSSILYQQASLLHNHMAYGRSFMDNVRPFAAVKDVLTSILVDVSRQIPEPPLKSKFRTMVNRYMFRPGAVTPMQGDGDLTPLIPPSAMQNFVFEAIKVYDSLTDRASISPVFQGQESKGQMTKYEVEQMLTQSIRSVAGMVGAARAWRVQQAELQFKIFLNHIEDITNFRFEAQGALNEASRVVEIRDKMPDTAKARYQALNELMKAENAYRKNGTKKRVYITSKEAMQKYSAVINYRVSPQQEESKASDDQQMVEKINMYRQAPNVDQRAVDKKLIRMLGDDEEEMLMPEQPEPQMQQEMSGMPQEGTQGLPPEMMVQGAGAPAEVMPQGPSQLAPQGAQPQPA